MGVPPASDFQALLAEDRWIRRLAAKLVLDASTADDLVQDAYLTALTSDARPRAPRAWLSGLLRNLWRDLARSDARRARRELRSAKPEATASTDELVAEVELRRYVAELVLGLEEPLRRALILRFFKGHSLPALARAERISVSTAHERVERGLALLRTRLDRAHGGERRAWALCMAALARSPGWTHWISGGTTMAMGTKIATASIVLGGALVWLAHERRSAPPAGSVAQARVLSSLVDDGEGTALATPPAQPPRTTRGARSTASSAVYVATAVASLRGRVLDVRQAPLGGIEIGCRDHETWDGTVLSRCESGSDGRFELPLPAEAGVPRPYALTPGRATLSNEVVDGEWLIVLTDTAAYSGRVVDESGGPIGGVELSLEPRPGYFREHGYFRPLDPNQEGWKTRCDDDGRFAITAAPAGEAVVTLARGAGYPPTWTRVPPGREQDVCIVLQRSEGIALTGVVIGPTGEPLSGASVSMGRDSATSSEDGSFTVLWRPSAVYRSDATNGSAVRRTETHINAVKEGYGPVHEELAGHDAREPIVLQLRPHLSIRGRVVDTRGEALSGVVVWPMDPTPLGDTVGFPATSDPFFFAINVESLLRGGEGVCRTTEDGSFELDQLFERAYHLMAFDPRTTSSTGPHRVEAGASGIVLELDRETGLQRIAGRLVTAAGAGLEGAIVTLTRPIPEDPAFHPPLGTGELTTDAEGRFEFSAFAAPGASLTFFHSEFFLFTCPLERFGDLQQLEIVAPTLCELQIELADPARARSARILDGEGEPLFALQFRGSGASMISPLYLVEGKSEVVRISDAARTLVLYQGEEEVERLPIRLEPGQRTVLRP
jgi:RNA polymerase sigma factor (sigma-70 family)